MGAACLCLAALVIFSAALSGLRGPEIARDYHISCLYQWGGLRAGIRLCALRTFDHLHEPPEQYWLNFYFAAAAGGWLIPAFWVDLLDAANLL